MSVVSADGSSMRILRCVCMRIRILSWFVYAETDTLLKAVSGSSMRIQAVSMRLTEVLRVSLGKLNFY